jgi:Carboxypeptidase regulatory-like domain
MKTRGSLVALILVSAPAWAQNGASAAAGGIEIHGVVTEVGLGSGLAGAEVTAYEFAGPEQEKKVYSTTVTDGHGEFRFHPERYGNYWIEVSKPSYFATIPMDGVSSSILAKPPAAETGTLVTVSAAHPSLEVRLALMRPGELTGTVTDEDDKPLDKALVELTMAGLPALSKTTTRTGADGVFAVKLLMPGEYSVKISKSPGALTSLTEFTDEDVKVVDESLESVYWPGVPEESAATPVRVSPGAPTSLGTIHLRKTPSYRARISVKGCQPDDLPHLSVIPSGDSGLLFVLAAGARFPLSFGGFALASCDDVLLRDLKSGSYAFELSSKGAWARTPVEISNKNVEVTLTLAPGADITGHIIGREDMPLPPLDKIQITLLPREAGEQFSKPSRPDSKGAFELKDVRGPSHRLQISGLTDQYYVKEIRTDGQVSPDGVLRLYHGSQIEIVLDDQPATITGSVTAGSEDGEKPFSQPLVYVAKWPSLEVLDRPVLGDNGGQFRITGLEPGEYRVLAVQSAPLPDGDQIKAPMLAKLWSSAEKVTVERGASGTVTLELSDPLQ